MGEEKQIGVVQWLAVCAVSSLADSHSLPLPSLVTKTFFNGFSFWPFALNATVFSVRF